MTSLGEEHNPSAARLEGDDYRGPFDSGVTGGTIFAGAVGLVLRFFVVAGAVMPE